MKTLARAADLEDVLRRCRGIRTDTPRRWGRMNAHQMVRHLVANGRMVLGSLAVRPEHRPLGSTVLKWVVLYAPLPWPHGIRTSPELDQVHADTTGGAALAAELAGHEALLRQIASRPPDAAWPRHPVFGPLSGTAWLRWGYLHTDHHLRQFGA